MADNDHNSENRADPDSGILLDPDSVFQPDQETDSEDRTDVDLRDWLDQDQEGWSKLVQSTDGDDLDAESERKSDPNSRINAEIQPNNSEPQLFSQVSVSGGAVAMEHQTPGVDLQPDLSVDQGNDDDGDDVADDGEQNNEADDGDSDQVIDAAQDGVPARLDPPMPVLGLWQAPPATTRCQAAPATTPSLSARARATTSFTAASAAAGPTR